MITRRYALLLAALAALLLVSCVISLGFGPARVPGEVVWRIACYNSEWTNSLGFAAD